MRLVVTSGITVAHRPPHHPIGLAVMPIGGPDQRNPHPAIDEHSLASADHAWCTIPGLGNEGLLQVSVEVRAHVGGQPIVHHTAERQ